MAEVKFINNLNELFKFYFPLFDILQWGTCTYQITIPKGFICSSYTRPKFILSHKIKRICGLTSTVGSSHSSAVSSAIVCGALCKILSFWSVSLPSISKRIEIIASQNRSNSDLSSLSVGSIIIVPTTGNETVGEWNP